MEPVKVEYTTVKAWLALAFLIITAITSSPLVEVTGPWHTFLSLLTVVIGAVTTWAVPNKVKTIDGEAV